MIIFRPATYSDVEEVMDRISDVSFNEMCKCGVDSAWKGLLRAKKCKDGGGLDVMVKDGLPVCIIGGVKEGHDFQTWFIGSVEYFEGGIPVIRASRRYMARLAKAHPNFDIVSGTRSDHPEVDRWFEILGFKLKDRGEGIRIYSYSPNSTKDDTRAKFPA